MAIPSNPDPLNQPKIDPTGTAGISYRMGVNGRLNINGKLGGRDVIVNVNTYTNPISRFFARMFLQTSEIVVRDSDGKESTHLVNKKSLGKAIANKEQEQRTGEAETYKKVGKGGLDESVAESKADAFVAASWLKFQDKPRTAAEQARIDAGKREAELIAEAQADADQRRAEAKERERAVPLNQEVVKRDFNEIVKDLNSQERDRVWDDLVDVSARVEGIHWEELDESLIRHDLKAAFKVLDPDLKLAHSNGKNFKEYDLYNQVLKPALGKIILNDPARGMVSISLEINNMNKEQMQAVSKQVGVLMETLEKELRAPG